LKAGGTVHFVAGRGSWSYVDDEEWETILAEFKVMNRNYAPYKAIIGHGWGRRNKAVILN